MRRFRPTRILTFSGGDHLFSARRRIWSDATAAHAAVWGSPAGYEARALAALERLGVTHVLVEKRLLETPRRQDLALVQPEFRDRWMEQIYEDRYYVLYRGRWTGETMSASFRPK